MTSQPQQNYANQRRSDVCCGDGVAKSRRARVAAECRTRRTARYMGRQAGGIKTTPKSEISRKVQAARACGDTVAGIRYNRHAHKAGGCVEVAEGEVTSATAKATRRARKQERRREGALYGA